MAGGVSEKEFGVQPQTRAAGPHNRCSMLCAPRRIAHWACRHRFAPPSQTQAQGAAGCVAACQLG